MIVRRPRTGPSRSAVTVTEEGVSTTRSEAGGAIVVGVAEVSAVHDATDLVRDHPVRRLEPQRAVVADRDA